MAASPYIPAIHNNNINNNNNNNNTQTPIPKGEVAFRGKAI